MRKFLTYQARWRPDDREYTQLVLGTAPRRLAWDPRWAGTDAGHRNDAASWGGQERLLSLDQFLRLQICGPGFNSHFLRQFEDGAAGDSFEQIVAGREQGLAGDDRNIKAGAFRDVSLNSTAASAP